MYRDDAWKPVELPTGETVEVQVELCTWGVRLIALRAHRGQALNSALLRRIPVGRIVHEYMSTHGTDRKLRLAPLSTMPRRTPAEQDAFYSSIAGAYLEAAELSSRPCADIAEGLGISTRTVQGWVAKARRRGHLPPAQPGRAHVEEARRVEVR